MEAKLAEKETILADDDHWFDHGANSVDKQHVIDNLIAASNYERGLQGFTMLGRWLSSN